MSGKQTHILLVEDESAHTELITRAFDDNRKQVRLAVVANLNEAKSYLATTTPVTQYLL